MRTAFQIGLERCRACVLCATRPQETPELLAREPALAHRVPRTTCPHSSVHSSQFLAHKLGSRLATLMTAPRSYVFAASPAEIDFESQGVRLVASNELSVARPGSILDCRV
jgi:hypothetical protein